MAKEQAIEQGRNRSFNKFTLSTRPGKFHLSSTFQTGASILSWAKITNGRGKNKEAAEILRINPRFSADSWTNKWFR